MKIQQTFFLILATFFSVSFGQAQPFTDVDSALEDIERRMDAISEYVSHAQKCLPEIREACEDADFRAQGPLFRKMHVLLDRVETEVFTVSTNVQHLTQFDARLETNDLQESCMYLASNEDAAVLALVDLTTATHEGDEGLVQEAMENLQAGLRSLRAMHANAAQQLRTVQRSL